MRVLVAVSDEYQRGKMVARYRNARCAVTVVDDVSDIAIARGDLDGLAEGYDLIVASEGLGAIFNRAAPGPGIAVVSPGDTLAKAFTTVARAHGHESHNLVIQQGKNTLELDMTRRSCRVNGHDVKLRPMEYKLLRVLALRRNTEIKSNTLTEAINGYYIKHLHYHLCHLRQKISPLIIDNTGGDGYSLNDTSCEVGIRQERHGIRTLENGAITYNGSNLGLSPKEKDILKALLANRQLTGKDCLTSVDICNIRKALARASSCEVAPYGYDFIETIRGQGYRLRPQPLKIEPIPKMLFSLGDGRLVIDTCAMVMKNTDNGMVEKLRRSEARILVYLAMKGRTASDINRAFRTINSGSFIYNIKGTIDALGLEPDNYITSDSSGYRLQNVRFQAQDLQACSTLAPAAE